MSAIIFNRKWRLTPNQYFAEETKKTQIVLHHTVGGSAKSTFDYWQSNSDRIATSYLIDRDGQIYEVFDSIYWAHHLGLKIPKNIIYNKSSIGIEIASEGALRTGKELNLGKSTNSYDEKYLYAFDGTKKLWALTETNYYYKHHSSWRGYTYFDEYEPEQVKSTFCLLNHLCEKFGIHKIVSGTNEFDEKFYEFKGIIVHSNVRKDKTDLHPGWNWNLLRKNLESKNERFQKIKSDYI